MARTSIGESRHEYLSDEESKRDDNAQPSTPVQASKRKRDSVTTPTTQADENEIAIRRRQRQTAAFQQRRKSLTRLSIGGASSAPNRQYISDMYSTIIQMSSENVRRLLFQCTICLV